MTEAQVLALINQFIVTNGNNEITAEVLRPILVAILEQPNDKVGELGDLDTTDQTNIVNAINEVINNASTTFVIHSGSDSPNTTPPASYSIGDWYIRNGSSIYQYNGSTWVLLTSNATIESSEKPPYTLATAGQTVISVDPEFLNIDLHINEVEQIEGPEVDDDYTYTPGTITMKYGLQENDRIIVRGYKMSSEPTDAIPPIPNIFDDLAALVAAQANQLTGYIYEVTDGSGFTGIDSGVLWVKYKGTTEGNEDDYTWQPRPEGSGAVDSVNGQTGAVVLLEEQIEGTATYNGSTTGAANLDISTFSSHYAILTGNTVHTLTGLPASGKTVVKEWFVKSTTTESYAVANADKTIGSFVADGTVNRVLASVSVFPTTGQFIVITYENLP